jgi:hypothetical protein
MPQEETYYLQEFTTETGQQEILAINKSHDVSFGLSCGATDIIDIEITLDNINKTFYLRHVALGDISGSIADTTEGPITGIGINIKTNNSNNIKLEVRTSYRGG